MKPEAPTSHAKPASLVGLRLADKSTRLSAAAWRARPNSVRARPACVSIASDRFSSERDTGPLSSVQHELLADCSLELSPGSGPAVNAGNLIDR